MEHELPGLVAMYHGRGLLESAIEWLTGQYRVVLERRLADPLFDLRPFAHNHTDVPQLNELMRTILPCDVIVGRPGDMHAVERDVMLAFGMPGLVSYGYRVTEILRVLEAQVDFVMSHLGAVTFRSSDDVEYYSELAADEDVLPCPFYTSCGLQLRRDNAGICFRRPWRIYDGTRPNCWYGTAIASTLGAVRVENIIRDPREVKGEHRRILEAVRRRAYEIWEERDRESGNDWKHWFQARRELGVSEDYHL